jgi:hypothetical protein
MPTSWCVMAQACLGTSSACYYFNQLTASTMHCIPRITVTATHGNMAATGWWHQLHGTPPLKDPPETCIRSSKRWQSCILTNHSAKATRRSPRKCSKVQTKIYSKDYSALPAWKQGAPRFTAATRTPQQTRQDDTAGHSCC